VSRHPRKTRAIPGQNAAPPNETASTGAIPHREATFEIEKLVYGGDGLARLAPDAEGRRMAVFVPFTLPGEHVAATLAPPRNGFIRGTLDRVITASPDRVSPPCPYFTRCGGCSLQHSSYELQLAAQRQVLRETLQRAGVTPPLEIQTLSANPYHYRNRIRLHVHSPTAADPTWQLGYLARRSGRLLPVNQCPIAAASLEAAIRALSEPSISSLAPDEISEIELFTNHDESTLLLTAWSRAPRPAFPNSRSDFSARFSSWLAACQHSLPHLAGAVALAERTPGFAPTVVARAGTPALTYRVAGEDYRVSAGSFFQTNLRLLDSLVEHVLAAVAPQPGQSIWDLYAGVGLFARAFARRSADVSAVEASPLAANDLENNLSALPGRTMHVSSTTEQYLSRHSAHISRKPNRNRPNATPPDAIFLDPPRTGVGKAVTAALARIAAPRLVYLSCDPSTLARDLAALLSSGYHCEQLALVDMFPQTGHIESLAVLRR
jgi:23S rRNA (uracil1939-C5)-methyltransferase